MASTSAASDAGALRLVSVPILLVAAAFAAGEFVVNSLPRLLFLGLNMDPRSPVFISLYDSANAAIRLAFVPFALFLAFYLLASRMRINLRRSYVSIAVSLFLGTFGVFLAMQLPGAFGGSTAPGLTPAQTAFEGVGGSIWTSLNHTFIGFSAVFLWIFLKGPSGSAQSGLERRTHGLEDLSIVGVVMVAVYFWEYLARAYATLHPLTTSNQVVTILASLLAATSPTYFVVAIWQQVFLLVVLPFVLYFLVARYLALDPFRQGRKIALVIFMWGLFLRTIPPYFYIYTAKLFDPNAFPGATLGSTFADEFIPMNFMGIISSSLTFLFLGITAVVFAFYSRQVRNAIIVPPTSGSPLSRGANEPIRVSG